VIGMEFAKDLNKSFREGDTPINTSDTSVEFLGKDANSIIVAVPSEMATCCCMVKEVAVNHEVRE